MENSMIDGKFYVDLCRSEERGWEALYIQGELLTEGSSLNVKSIINSIFIDLNEAEEKPWCIFNIHFINDEEMERLDEDFPESICDIDPYEIFSSEGEGVWWK